MKKTIKLTEKDIKIMVEKTLNEQSFDADRYQETQDAGYGRLLEYLEFLTVKGVIDEGIMDEILGLAESYADDMWREGAQGGFADKYM